MRLKSSKRFWNASTALGENCLPRWAMISSLAWSLSTGYIGVRNSVYTSEKYQQMIAATDESTIYEVGAADNLKKIAEIKEMTYNTSVFRGSSNARANAGRLMDACLISDDLESNIDTLFAESVADTEQYLG